MKWHPRIHRFFRWWLNYRGWDWVTVPIPDHVDARGNRYVGCTVTIPREIAHLLSRDEPT